GFLHSRKTFPRRHRHARQNHHHLAPHLGLRIRRQKSELPHRRHTQQFRPGRPLHRQRFLYHRRRRVRHRLLRQTQQVRPLPSRSRHHQQHRVRPRRHLRQSRRHPALLPPPHQSRSPQRPR